MRPVFPSDLESTWPSRLTLSQHCMQAMTVYCLKYCASLHWNSVLVLFAKGLHPCTLYLQALYLQAVYAFCEAE